MIYTDVGMIQKRFRGIKAPSEQKTAIEKVKQNMEEIDFSKGILTYVDVDFSEYREMQCHL